MAIGAKALLAKHGIEIALGLVGVGTAFYLSSNASNGKRGGSALPLIFGGQRGVQSRSSQRSNDSGTLATQVIGDIVGQRTALQEAKDQLTLGEAQLTEEQNVAYRDSNVAVQENLNNNGLLQSMEQPWYASILGSAFNDLPMAFGFPPMGGGGYGSYPSPYGMPAYGSSPYSGGFGGFGGGWPEGYGSSGGGGGFLAWLESLFYGGGVAAAPSGSGGGGGFLN